MYQNYLAKIGLNRSKMLKVVFKTVRQKKDKNLKDKKVIIISFFGTPRGLSTEVMTSFL